MKLLTRCLFISVCTWLQTGCGGGGTSQPPISVTLTTSTLQVYQGDAVTVMWSAKNATTCTASGAWSGTLSTSGSQNEPVTQLGSLTYNITCSNGVQSSAAQAMIASTEKPFFVEVPDAFPDPSPLYVFWDQTEQRYGAFSANILGAFDLNGDGRKELFLFLTKPYTDYPNIITTPPPTKLAIYSLGADNKFLDIEEKIINSPYNFEATALSMKAADFNGDGKQDFVFSTTIDEGRVAGSFNSTRLAALISATNGKYDLVHFGEYRECCFYSDIAIGREPSGKSFIYSTEGSKFTYQQGSFKEERNFFPDNFGTSIGFLENKDGYSDKLIYAAPGQFHFDMLGMTLDSTGKWISAGRLLSSYPIIGEELFVTWVQGATPSNAYIRDMNGKIIAAENSGYALGGSCSFKSTPTSDPIFITSLGIGELQNYKPGNIVYQNDLLPGVRLLGAKIENGKIQSQEIGITDEIYYGWWSGFACKDVNGDGYDDILKFPAGDISNNNESIPHIYLNQKDGTLKRFRSNNMPSFRPDVPVGLESSFVADIDGDGISDVVIFPHSRGEYNRDIKGTMKFYRGLKPLASTEN